MEFKQFSNDKQDICIHFHLVSWLSTQDCFTHFCAFSFVKANIELLDYFNIAKIGQAKSECFESPLLGHEANHFSRSDAFSVM